MGAESVLSGIAAGNTGTGGSKDISTELITTMLKARAAYRACVAVGVEVEFCESQVAWIDRELRARLKGES